MFASHGGACGIAAVFDRVVVVVPTRDVDAGLGSDELEQPGGLSAGEPIWVVDMGRAHPEEAVHVDPPEELDDVEDVDGELYVGVAGRWGS